MGSITNIAPSSSFQVNSSCYALKNFLQWLTANKEKKIHKILCYLQKRAWNILQKYLCGRFYVLGEEK